MTYEPTDLELMQLLVKELPELLVEDKFSSGWRFYWRPPHPTFAASHVTLREWDWIVREVEKKMDSQEWVSYWSFLEPMACRPNNTSILSASWQMRATAYFKLKGMLA